jgi:hypothetical protein
MLQSWFDEMNSLVQQSMVLYMYHLQLYIYIYLYMNFGTWNGRPAACAGRLASLRERHAASLTAPASGMQPAWACASDMQMRKKRPRGKTVKSCHKYMYFLDKSD